MIYMVHTLLVLTVLLQSVDWLSALPDDLDKALIYFGKSDKELKHFYRAMSNHEFSAMDEIFENGTKFLAKQKFILSQLLSQEVDKGTKAYRLKEILIVQIQTLIEKMSVVFKSKAEEDVE